MVWFHLYEIPRVVKFIDTDSRQLLGTEGREKLRVFNAYRVSEWEDEETSGDGEG